MSNDLRLDVGLELLVCDEACGKLEINARTAETCVQHDLKVPPCKPIFQCTMEAPDNLAVHSRSYTGLELRAIAMVL